MLTLAQFLRPFERSEVKTPRWRDATNKVSASNESKHRLRDVEFVAGNGLINRRALLGRGVAFAGAIGTGDGGSLTGAAAEPLKDDPWSLAYGGPTLPRQAPSRFEANVVRTLSNPNNELRNSHARTPHHLLNGTITPSSLHFTINHSGLPDIDPDKHRLVIHGLVREPKIFSLEDLARYPMVSRMGFVECGGNSAPMFSSQPMQATAQALHGLVSNSEWTGVLLSTLLEETGIDPKAKWFLAEGADSLALHRSVPVKKALDDAMIALYQNGERIQPGQGYPMRLWLPGYEGNMNVKYLRRLKLIDQPAMSFYEARPIPDSAERAGMEVPLPAGGQIVHHPSLIQPLVEGAGLLRDFRRRLFRHWADCQGHGLGRRRQELGAGSAAGAGEPQGLHRFRMPWRWDGQPVVLQSRAWDEAGNVQPTREEFVAMRGQTSQPLTNPLAFPNQHNNSITSWGIDNKGEIKHVYA